MSDIMRIQSKIDSKFFKLKGKSVIGFYVAAGEYGFLSNLWPCRIEFEGKVYTSAEHAYQSGKSSRQEINDYIAAAPYPRIAAAVGHNLPVYDIRTDWHDIRLKRMMEVVSAKFLQNKDLAEKLMETGNAELQEKSNDRFWGIGRNRDGQNELGKMLMGLRETLKAGGMPE